MNAASELASATQTLRMASEPWPLPRLDALVDLGRLAAQGDDPSAHTDLATVLMYRHAFYPRDDAGALVHEVLTHLSAAMGEGDDLARAVFAGTADRAGLPTNDLLPLVMAELKGEMH